METAHLHFKIYKPFGMLSQFMSNDAKEARKKRFLSDLNDFPEGTMPVGRLDEKSEGLLLLTTDGKLSDLINRSGIEKEYYVQLDGDITKAAIERLEAGVEIGFSGKKYQTKPCKVQSLAQPPLLPEPDKKIRLARHRPTSWISITITEGKFRQVRKMTAAVGFPTLRLVRVRIADIHLKELLPGTVAAIPQLPLDTQIVSYASNEYEVK
ncbi:pseudouridine synthase [Arenibacter sp. 6A1]|uniref:pseudouridine synthase n=1 Tax=Arenibacter sp. 6A1 TaxID=2720391 RepID=UPI0014450171|nr:pseudouridine synthase [Arenibacter sp. 6A1]NKI25833.1 pseudouridine synthase [Arenibacter sp. 6A1]